MGNTEDIDTHKWTFVLCDGTKLEDWLLKQLAPKKASGKVDTDGEAEADNGEKTEKPEDPAKEQAEDANDKAED